MTKWSSRSLILLVLPLFAAIPALAQNNYRDCEAARQALQINNPNQLAPCPASPSVSPTLPALTTKQMVQQQVAGTVIDAFVKMLFSNDSQAKAQKQKMLAELQARQAEAARQHKIEEAKRLAAICDRLQATLKLSGLPTLRLKSDGEPSSSGGLHLKLGDDSSSSGHAGVPGLPGIALNDNTGNGGSTPYGIPGLPGIYTNGPATPATAPSGNTQSNTGGLALKLGDDSSISSIPAQQTQTNPSVQSGQAIDPRSMTPQQLADLASNLSPEQQQQLVNAMQAGSSAGTGTPVTNVLPASTMNSASGSVVHLSAKTTVSAAPPPTTTAVGTGEQASAPSAQSAGASSLALGQLQQTSAASQAAASAQTPEAAAAGARIGFDQAAGGTVPAAPASGGSFAALLASSNAQPSAAISTGTHGLSGTKSAVPTMVNTAVLAPPPPLPSVSAGSIVATSAPATPQPAPALTRTQQMTDQQLQNETCRAHAMLLRIGADSQKSSQELEDMAKEIRQTRREAVKAGLGCFSELAEKAFADKLDDKLDAEEERTHYAAFEKDARGLLKKAQDLQTDISKTGVEYQESDRGREDKLEYALNYLNAFYEYVRKGKAFPWVASAQCAIDFGYLATKVYMEQQQISLLNNNLDSASGSLKAESSVGAFYKKLVDESLRRGMDPKTFCR